MSTPVARFTSSRSFLWMALGACGGALVSASVALRLGPPWLFENSPWTPPSVGGLSTAWIAAILLALPAAALLLFYFLPSIEIHETHLRSGNREIPWERIRRLDQTGWNVPLVLNLTLKDDTRVMLLYPGNLETSASLLRYLRRYCREALLDGIPYRQFWGEPISAERKQLAPPRYPMLRPEDEEEVERLFQRLKTAGHLEHHQQDEK